MSSSSYSETVSDSTDSENSSTPQKVTKKTENKQPNQQENDNTESSEEDSSESESSQDSAKKTEVNQVKSPESNKKESSEEDSSEPESSEDSEEKSDVKQKQVNSAKKQSKSSSSEKESQDKSNEEESSSEEETQEAMDVSSSAKKSKAEQKKSTEKKEKSSEKSTKKKSTETQKDQNQSSTDKPKDRDAPIDASNKNDNDNSNNPPPVSNQNENDGRKMDRYGWYVDKKKLSKQEQQLIQIENQKESERTQKWLDMTKNWSSYMKKNRNKVAERIKKGIPDQMRSRAWALLCQAQQMKKKYPTPMSELLQRPKHQGYATIDKDLVRTFPQIGFFSKSGFIESLRRILYCYCQVDPVLGYTQGMSFIAGMFLSYMDEETAFYSFLNVMLGKRLNQRGYFLAGFPRLDKANLMLGCLMEKKCPKILKKMDSLGVIMSMFTPGWFLTVYQSYTWQPEFQLRIFERYLFYGTRGLLNFGIVIILYHQKILEKADMEEFLKILQHPDSSEKMTNWHSVLQEWDKNWLNKAEYEKLLTRCGVQKETENY